MANCVRGKIAEGGSAFSGKESEGEGEEGREESSGRDKRLRVLPTASDLILLEL